MVESDGLLRWEDYDFQSGSFYSIGSSKVVDELPEIDKSISGKPFISSSLDCYISGIYMTRVGHPKTVEIKKRYSINVKYSNSTLMSTINEARNEIQREFKKQYPKFQITSVFIPELSPIVPVQPLMFQQGSRMYKDLMEAGRYQNLMKLRQKRHIEEIKKSYNMDNIVVGKYRKK